MAPRTLPRTFRATCLATALAIASLGLVAISSPAAAGNNPNPGSFCKDDGPGNAHHHICKHDPIPASTLAATAAAELVAAAPAALHESPDDAYTASEPVASTSGKMYVPYNRTYKGLKVFGGDFVVVTDSSGQVQGTSVAQTKTVNLSTTPTTTAAQATAIALAATKGTIDSISTPVEVVFAIGRPRLAWEVVVRSHKGALPSVRHLFITPDGDADDPVHPDADDIAYSYDEVHAASGTSAYNGPNPVNINTTQVGGTFSLKDPTITNLSCQDAANNTTFTNTTNVWGDGNPATRVTGCVDALFAAQTEARMLSTWLGRNGFDGAGGGWPLRVGLNDVNAFYDGTQVQIGHNSANQWISSMDVVGHELGHGIDDHTPGGISGGNTQEFIADTFGAMTEWFANEPSPFDTPDYSVGEKINLVGSGPIRYMYNPSLVGDANCYSSTIPSQEVHAAAGPGNHWFYLLAEGTNPTDGQPTSPTCNTTTVGGIGIQNAARVLYNAMLLKTTGSTYLKYRTWTLTAAKNAFPGNCAIFNAVKAAWDAVSVPPQAADPTACSGVSLANPGNRTGSVGVATTLQLVGSDTVTGQTLTYSATGLPTGLTVNAASGLISGTPTAAGTFAVTATARDGLGSTASAAFTWTIGGAGGCAGPQLLANPGFESGNTAWVASPAVIGQNASGGEPTHGGTWDAWLDGYGTTHTDTISQAVTLKPGCSATLTFFLHIDTAETTTTVQFDKLTVTAGATTVATFSNLNHVAGYAQQTVNLSAFAGQTISLKFTGTEDSSLQTSFVLDDLSLTNF